MPKLNAKQMPKSYYCKHMVNGVAQYGDERIFVSTDTIKKMIKSFNDKPVYVEHQDVDIDNLQEQADGYVTDSFYNELDGWFWSKFVIVSDKGHDAIAKGWKVSNAYEPTKWGDGGTCLNVPYDREVLNGEFNHLAIVHNPRYEEACIMTVDDFKAYNDEKRRQLNELKNSKDETKRGKTMLKFFKKVEVTNADDLSEAFVTLENGENKSVAEMAELVNANINKAKENETEEVEKTSMADMKSKVKVGENEMSVEELKEAYENMVNKQNEEDEEKRLDEEEKAKEEEENKKNSLDEEEANKGKTHVDALKNAIAKGNTEDKPRFDSRQAQLARGASKY